MSMVLICKECGERVDLAPECPKCGNREKALESYIQLSAPSSRLIDNVTYDFQGEVDLNLIQDVASSLIIGYKACINRLVFNAKEYIFRPFFWYDPDDSTWIIQVKVYEK